MNLFYEAKKVLDKDGKVNPLGPYGKQKLTGREISAYFRRNPVKDATIRKAVSVALDLEGAMTTAAKEIKKFYGDKVLKSKEVQYALKYANESVIHEDDDISEGSFYGRDDLVKQFATPKNQKHLYIKLRKTDSKGTSQVSLKRKGNEDKIRKYKADGYKEVPVESVDEGKGTDLFKKYNSIINRLSDKEKDEVIELLYQMNSQSGRQYKQAFGKVKELLNLSHTPEGSNIQESSALNMIDKAFNTKGDKEFQYGIAKLLNMTGIQVAKGMQKQNPKGFELMVKALADNTKVKLQTDRNLVKMMRQAGIKEEIIQEVTQQEVNAVKKLSKDAEKMKKDYFKIAKMGDKELQDGKYNSYYESILKMQQKILSLIGALNNKMRMESTNLMDTYRLIGEQRVEFLEEEKKLKFTNIKDKTLEKHLKAVTKKVGAKLEKISGGFAVSDTDMRGFTAVVDYIFDKSIKKNMLDGGGMSDVTMTNENAVMSAPQQNMSKIKPMLTKLASKHKKVKVSFGTHSKGKFVDDNNINFNGDKKDIDMLMKDIQKNKSLMKMMEDVDPKKERLRKKREQIKQKIERERAAAKVLSDKIKLAQKKGDDKAEFNLASQRMGHYYEISHLKDKLADMKESFDVMDTYRDMMTEKVSYVEYKFKNKNDAQKAMDMFKRNNLMSFDINDDNLNGGELAVDAGKKDMTKYHKQVMQKFKPKIQMSENYRKLAQKGMGTETKKDARVGLELDYYDSKGNKHMGKIVKKSATGYTVQDDKTRKTHTFKFHDRVDAKKLLAASNEFDKNPLKGFPYNESLEEEVPEALRKQIERATADLQRARKFKSQASDRGDGRNALRRYQNKVWDAQDKLEALRDKAERLSNG